MAVIETWFNQDLKRPVKVQYLNGCVFGSDNDANLIGVNVFSDGSPVVLSGSVTGYCILPTGQSVPVAGTIPEGTNKAYIILPDTAYSIPGIINIIIKIVDDTTVTTVAAVVVPVFGIGNAVVDPSTATIEAWTAQITATLEALEAGAVMYSESQSLTTSQKSQARNNIGANTSATQISGNDYMIVIP